MSSEGGGGGSSGALRELLAIFAFEVDTKDLDKGESKLGEFFESVKKIGEGLAAAFAVDQLFEFVEAQAHAITGIEHMAAQVGISADEIQAWQYAAKASGYEADKFTNAMSRLQAAAGSSQGAKSFAALGISVKDAGGSVKEADQLFVDVAEAIRKTEDPTKRAAIATRLFGRSGRELLPFFEEGEEGIDKLIESFHQLGGAYTEEDIGRTKAFEKSQADLGLTWTGLKATITRVLMPAFTAITGWITTAAKAFVSLVQHSNIVQSTLLLLGAAASVFAVQMAVAAAPVLLIAAALAALVLAIDEVITFFEGGDTEIGDAIDKIFGKGQSAEVVKELKGYWYDLRDAIHDIAKYLEDADAAMKRFFDTANDTPVLGKILKVADIGYTRTLDSGATSSSDRAAASMDYLRHLGTGGASTPALVAQRSPFASYAPTAESLQSITSSSSSTAGDVTVNQTINASPGMSEQQVGDIAARKVQEVTKQNRQAHSDNLQRAGTS